jgi:folate-binding Fe-S cluster repair protein YgfZ
MVEFAGWDMPLYYSGISEEHKQCRTGGALFDVSHMGRVKFVGRHARKLLETLCTRRIGDMVPGQCRYSLVCNPQGGVHDDVIVYKIDEDDFLVVVNASNRAKLLPHFEAVRAKNDFSVKIDDQTEATAMIALQGPKIMPLVATNSSEIAALKRYRFAVKDFVIASATVSRTGYTGEDGVEVILPAAMVGMALSALGKHMDPLLTDLPHRDHPSLDPQRFQRHLDPPDLDAQRLLDPDRGGRDERERQPWRRVGDHARVERLHQDQERGDHRRRCHRAHQRGLDGCGRRHRFGGDLLRRQAPQAHRLGERAHLRDQQRHEQDG